MIWVLLILVTIVTYVSWQAKRWRNLSPQRSRWRLWARIGVAWAALMILIGQGYVFSLVLQLKNSNPSTTAVMEQRDSEARARGARPKRDRQWVDYTHISPTLVRAVVAGEDPKFMVHSGFNWDGMLQALQYDLEQRRIIRGNSTISQQLAKNLFLSTSRNPARKLQELLITRELEWRLDKRRILELYLNVVEWGDGIYGAEAAARHYFNTSAASLTDEQASFLAAILPMPSRPCDPSDPPQVVRDRMNLILENMHRRVSREDVP
jgi:monofunctional biosynthetic peptidoglycan transglycosylase